MSNIDVDYSITVVTEYRNLQSCQSISPLQFLLYKDHGWSVALTVATSTWIVHMN
jgi:hypothetical protein